MAIQMRRGAHTLFDPTKMLPGEWAIVLEDDPAAGDGRSAYICFAAGTVKRVALFEDMVENIISSNQLIVQQLTAGVADAVSAANDAASAANSAASEATTSQAANNAAQTANDSAQADNDTAQAANDTAQAKNNADQALNNQSAQGLQQHFCTTGEYNPETLVPNIESPASNLLYLVPTGETDDEYLEYLWSNHKWNPIGSTTAKIEYTTTAQIDAVAADQSPTGDQALNTTGLSYFWAKLKAWAYAAFAGAAHTHAAADIASGTLPISRGGTEASDAATARANLGAAATSHAHDAADITSGTLDAARIPSLNASKIGSGKLPISRGGTGAATAAAAASAIVGGQAIKPASVAATGAVSGASVADSTGTLAAVRESVSRIGEQVIQPSGHSQRIAFEVVASGGTIYRLQLWGEGKFAILSSTDDRASWQTVKTFN